jgi:hypothetical protein
MTETLSVYAPWDGRLLDTHPKGLFNSYVIRSQLFARLLEFHVAAEEVSPFRRTLLQVLGPLTAIGFDAGFQVSKSKLVTDHANDVRSTSPGTSLVIATPHTSHVISTNSKIKLVKYR